VDGQVQGGYGPAVSAGGLVGNRLLGGTRAGLGPPPLHVRRHIAGFQSRGAVLHIDSWHDPARGDLGGLGRQADTMLFNVVSQALRPHDMRAIAVFGIAVRRTKQSAPGDARCDDEVRTRS